MPLKYNLTSFYLLTIYAKCSGYVPPEYVKKGIYSMKYDVYSFGVLLLQIISGKQSSRFYGPSENMHLLQYVSHFTSYYLYDLCLFYFNFMSELIMNILGLSSMGSWQRSRVF